MLVHNLYYVGCLHMLFLITIRSACTSRVSFPITNAILFAVIICKSKKFSSGVVHGIGVSTCTIAPVAGQCFEMLFLVSHNLSYIVCYNLFIFNMIMLQLVLCLEIFTLKDLFVLKYLLLEL